MLPKFSKPKYRSPSGSGACTTLQQHTMIYGKGVCSHRICTAWAIKLPTNRSIHVFLVDCLGFEALQQDPQHMKAAGGPLGSLSQHMRLEPHRSRVHMLQALALVAAFMPQSMQTQKTINIANINKGCYLQQRFRLTMPHTPRVQPSLKHPQMTTQQKHSCTRSQQTLPAMPLKAEEDCAHPRGMSKQNVHGRLSS